MGATAPSKSVPSTAAAVYRRREPTATALYPIVQHHLESFLALATGDDSRSDPVPHWAEDDFRAYLRCGILAHGFARARCSDCGAERLVAFSCYPQRKAICSSHLAPDRERVDRAVTYSLEPNHLLIVSP